MHKINNCKFGKAFITLLEQDDTNLELSKQIEQDLGKPGISDAEADALNDTLDDDTTAEQYLTDPEADKQLQRQIDNRNREIASVIESWVNKIEEFTEFLNGTSDSSLQSILAKAQPGTLFAKVQQNTNRKLANCATELASISETLKSFVGQKAISSN